jgi:fibronectin type 3 domain-containing protein
MISMHSLLIRRPLVAASVAAVLATAVTSCDSPTRPPQLGSVAPAMALVQADSATLAALVLPLTGVRATVIGPTQKVVNLQLSGTTLWTGRVDSLLAGTYEVVIEGLAAGQVQYYGRTLNVIVARGSTTSPGVSFAPAVSVVQDPPLPNTTSFSQRITFGAVAGATGYVVQLSRTPDFSSGVIEVTTAATNPLVVVNDAGTWHVRTRAVLPNTSSPIGFSLVRTFDVVAAPGGRTGATAIGKSLASLAPDTTRERNITVNEREDFYEFSARAGDSLFVETFAARLALASGLNTVLTLFRADGTTIVAQNDDITGTTDSRLVAVAPATETYRVRVTGASNTSGHYELVMELRRLPAAPSDLVAIATSGTSVALTWTDNADNETWFNIERCASVACTNFAVLDSVAAGVVSFADSTVAVNNTYRYRVRARNAVGTSSATAVATVSTQGPTAPSALSATTVSGTRIDLAWTDNSGDETGFRVERCTGATCDFSVVTVVATVAANTVAYADVSAAVDQNYSYRVVAFNGVAASEPSNTATANTIRPDAPTSLVANVTSPTHVVLGWTFAGTADRVLIERCDGGTCTTFAAIDSVLPGVTQFEDLTPTGSAIHRYRVRARNVAGFSDASNLVSADVRLPAAPTNFTATTVSATRIDLAWTDNADNELDYEIQRCTGAGCATFPDVFSAPAGATTFADTTVTAGLSYTYRIRARAAAGPSEFAGDATANTQPPATPTALAATTISGTQIDLAWTNNAPDAIETRIERCSGVSCANFVEIAVVPGAQTTYQNVGGSFPVVLDSTYSYRIRARNAAGMSSYSNTATTNTIQASAPNPFSATVIDATSIQLNWTASTPGVTGYVIHRCDSAGCTTFAPVAELGVMLSAVDAVAAGGDYRYVVRAENSVGLGHPSDTVSVNTRTPAAPTGLVAQVLTGAVQLTWTDNADNELSTVIQRCAGGACVPVDVDTVLTVDLATWTDSSVVANTEYTYRVRAENIVGASANSTESFANTLIAAPVTVLSATPVSPTQIDLAWTASASQGTGLIVAYTVYRCAGSCDPSTGAAVVSLPANAVAYADTSVSAASEYTYVVLPRTAFGETASAGSATVVASTALPTAPSALVGTLLSATSIQLAWTDNSDNETGFEIAQCAGVGCTNFTTIATTAADAVTFLADTLTASVRYRFIVRAVNSAGASAWSDTLNIATTVPAVPTNLAAFITDVAGNFRLVWTDASDNESGFDIEYCVGAGCESWTPLGSVPANTTQIDLGSGGASTYRFRIRAVNAAGSSAPSAFTQITGDGPYAAPAGTIATTTGPTSIRLTWSDQTDNETVFRIVRCTGAACDPLTGTVVDSVPRDTTSFDDTTVSTGALYRYAVVAVNGFAELASPAFDGNTMPPGAPGTLSATTVSNTEIALLWSDGGPYETGYVIERCEGAACTGFAPVDTVPANFVSFNDTGLSANATYRYRVQAINAVAASAYSNIVERTTDIPATPTGLSALAMTGTRIDLAWTDNATNEDVYIVERCAGACDASGTFGVIESNLAPNSQSYTDNTVSAGLTYSYRVLALNSGGVSPYTNIATATTAAPIDPTDLTVTTLSGTLIELTWTDNATNELSYQIERCTSATCPTFTLRRTLGANASSYVDTVVVDDEYTYRVRAVNNVGSSGYTLAETANTFLPAVATDFTAVTVSGTRIDLTWTDNATNEDGYVLERCSGVGCSEFVVLDSLPPDAASYQNDGVATGTAFTYRLYAYNVAGQSAFAGPSTATTISPATPTGLAAVLAAPGQIDLSWIDNATNELQYRVERCSAGLSRCATADSMNVYAVEIATLGPDATFHSDAGLASNTLYFYRVRATNTAGSSAYSSIVSRSTGIPAAPTGVIATTILATRIDLTWTDASANEDGFRVERCIGSNPCTSFTQIVELPANRTSHADSTLTAGLEVWYRVVAFNGGGGNTSSTVTATTIVPAAPTGFVGVADGQAAVNLNWTDNATDESGFSIERCTGLDCSAFAVLQTLAANTVTFVDATVAAGNVYRYRLRAFGNGNSEYTPIVSVATILPNAVTNLVATALSDTRVDLTWTDNTSTDSLWNETEFQIYRCDGAACTPTVLRATVGRDTTYFSDSPLTPGAAFSYHVVAANLAGSAAPSNVATSATTVPAIPTALADSTVSATAVLLMWVDNASNELGYEIQRCAGSGCADFVPVDTAAANSESILIDGLIETTAYRFRVRAFNASGNSGYSNIVLARSGAPLAPTDLVGAIVSPTQVNLSWADNAENETAYIVERCDGTGCTGFVAIDSLLADVTSYQDVGTVIDTTYVYRVRASNGVGPSAFTAAVTVSTYRPATPTDLVATPISATRVDLTWTDVAVNDTVIIVERCLGSGCTTFADIASLAPGATAFSDTTVTVGNTYNYRLRAENVAGASAPTTAVEVGTFIPSDPSALTATTNSPTLITLNWADNSDTELFFRIERCVGLGCADFTELVEVAANATSYADASVTLGNSYTYRVIARGGGGNSNPSNTATAHTFPAAAVTAVTASPLTATTLQLSWATAEFATLYQIATVSGADTTLFASVSSTVTDTVVTVTTGLIYNFVVRATNAAGAGAYAGVVVEMTPPPAPGDLAVFPLTTSQASLSWIDTSDRETGVEVERAFFSGGGFGAYQLVASLGANVTSYVDPVPSPTSRYRYRVRALNQIGAGAYSNVVDLTLTAPAAPTSLAASVTAPGQITLTWTDNSDSEQSFLVERSIGDNLTFTQVATVGPNVQLHVDSSSVAINTTYFYRVRAVNSIGASAYTNQASAVTTVPSPVAALSSTILNSTSIQLNWDGAGTVGELGFRVYRCEGGSCADFALLDGSVPADAITYTDVAASYGITYRYQVRPYNVAGEPATNLTASRLLVLPRPESVVALPVDRTSLRVKWNAIPFTWETGFEVEQCVGLTCADFAPLTSVATNDSMTISAGLPANGAWHRYRVRAVADGNVGPWSVVASSHTPKEVTLGDTLVTVAGGELVSQNMTHYVVAMPVGSPTVEVFVGNDPGGTTTNNGTYLIVQRGKGIERPTNQIFNAGTTSDTLCAPGIFTRSGIDPTSVTCSLPHPGVTTTDYYITTWSNTYTNLYLSALPGPTNYAFSNCAQEGRIGPAQAQCNAAYAGTSLAGLVTVADSGFQDWTVPFSGRWVVTATGAAGASGDPNWLGGRGARISGEFVLTAGQNLRMAVGQMGRGAASGSNGGGGGGSFVYNITGSTPLLIAGGGGGTRTDVAQNGCDASTSVFGTVASGGATTTACTVKDSGAGLGGIVSAASWGSAGAGFNGDGANDASWGTGGRSWTNFMLGGSFTLSSCVFTGEGGFGGGGSGAGCWGGGGGGGYSGGDGGRVAGGGGSFNAGTNTSATAGVGTTHGTIILKYLGPIAP